MTDAASPPSAAAAPSGRHDVLREDIRFLGRILGEVIREQAGAKVFDVVETVRRLAVQFRRGTDASEAGVKMNRLLNRLSPVQTNSVVRAFSYFSHLANIAEDLHQIRVAPRRGTGRRRSRTRHRRLCAGAPARGPACRRPRSPPFSTGR